MMSNQTLIRMHGITLNSPHQDPNEPRDALALNQRT